MELNNLGEFGLIDLIRNRFKDIPLNRSHFSKVGEPVGIGDDCAVWPIDAERSLVVTTDMLVEGVHFLKESISPLDLGYKSLAVNLSDIAAMGATPAASFLSLALPKELNKDWIDFFLEGYHTLSAQYQVALLGGDTTGSKGAIMISVTAIGVAQNDCLKLRSGASVGDKIFVTSPLGGSAQGLIDIESGIQDSVYIAQHHRPKPFISEGAWLGRQRPVSAMMDLSDGLASDLSHILRASRVGAQVMIEKIPVETSIELAVMGGEDYALLLTIEGDQAQTITQEFERNFKTRLYEIGTIIPKEGQLTWLKNGRIIQPQWKVFKHF